MYAVIQTGGKQYRVAEGDRIDVELLGGDDTLFAKSHGVVKFGTRRGRNLVDIVPADAG